MVNKDADEMDEQRDTSNTGATWYCNSGIFSLAQGYDETTKWYSLTKNTS
jgi:hypothetical protein